MPRRFGIACFLATPLCAGIVGLAHGANDAPAANTGGGSSPARAAGPATPTRPAAKTPSSLPPAVAAIVGRSGLPAKSFAFEVRPVERGDTPPLLSFRADEPCCSPRPPSS